MVALGCPTAKYNLGPVLRSCAAFATHEVVVVGHPRWNTLGSQGSHRVRDECHLICCEPGVLSISMYALVQQREVWSMLSHNTEQSRLRTYLLP
jgi:hypothetical protein